MLTEMFGNHPQVKIIELLLSNPHSEYSEKDLLERAGIGGDTLHVIILLKKFRICLAGIFSCNF